MTNMELYNGIQNPLDQKNFMDDLLTMYRDYGKMYSAFTEFYKEDDTMFYNPSAAAKLYSTIYNNWKKRMTTRTITEWNRLIAEGKVEKDIFELVEYLKKIPDETTEEARIKGRWSEDERLRELLRKYGCFTSSWNSGEYIRSVYTSGYQEEKEPTEHRLYINVPGIYLHEFMLEFIKECEKKGLPYYIKYYEEDVRDDSFILYSSTKRLTAYVELLKGMEKTHPGLISKIKKPPIVTGKINNWIGYGSEPIGKADSYHGKREVLYEAAINKKVKTWFRENKDKKIEYNGQQLSFSDYAVEKVIDAAIDKAKKDPEFSPEKDYFYFDGRDIVGDAQAGTRWIRNELKAKLKEENLFEKWINNKGTWGIEFIRNGIGHWCREENYYKVWKGYYINRIKGRPQEVEEIKQIIRELAEKKGIDPNKVCFDLENVALMKEEDKRIADQEAERQRENAQQKPKAGASNTQQKEKQTRSPETACTYKTMTDAEIRASREKLGINVGQNKNASQPQQSQQYRIKFNNGTTIKKENKARPAKTKSGYIYIPMTDEQVASAQKKLGIRPTSK